MAYSSRFSGVVLKRKLSKNLDTYCHKHYIKTNRKINIALTICDRLSRHILFLFFQTVNCLHKPNNQIEIFN